MKHEHDEIFGALRAELNLELDDDMAAYIDGEPLDAIVDGRESADGRVFAADVARTHGLDGIRSLYRCLKAPAIERSWPSGDTLLDRLVETLRNPVSERSMDVAIREQLKGKSDGFRLGVRIFCEQSGVV